MNKTLLIFKNELYSTLKRKGFVITTLALPVLGILALLVYQLVSGLSKPEEEVKITKVGYVDEVGIFADFTNYNELELIQYEGAEEANQSMVRGDIQEYFIIPADYLQSGLVTRFSMKTELETPSNVYNAMRDFLIQNMLQDKVSPELAYRVNYPLGLSTVILDKAGQVTDTRAGFGMYIISYLFSLLLLLSIFTASGYLLQGLSEEKENRIMEVLLSSISTRQMITGKVLALGVAGLIQIVLWLASGYLLLNMASSSIGGLFNELIFPPSVVILSLVYFILGYFLFAILMAGLGAIAPTQRDGQQMSVIFTLFGAVPYFLMPFIIENGDHIVTQILTIFPLTAPLTVMMRISAGIPVWELAVSIVVMGLSIWGALVVVSRIFRVFLLMYGKTPGWKEIFKSLREAGNQ